MPRKHDDAVVTMPLASEAQVIEYLRLHPDFLLRHPELLLALSPPSRWSEADPVVDMQVFMIDRLREEIERVKGAAESLIHTSRYNMSTQNRTHQAILTLLDAESVAELAEAVSDDLPALLGVDVATLCFEDWPAQDLAALAVAGIHRIPVGRVEALLGGPDHDCALTEEMPGDPVMFGDGAGLVLSSAIVRISPGEPYPEGALALGSRHGSTFHAGQGTELLTFLARVIESCFLRLRG